MTGPGLIGEMVVDAGSWGLADADVAGTLLPALCPLLANSAATGLQAILPPLSASLSLHPRHALQIMEVASVCHQCLSFIESHRCAMLKTTARLEVSSPDLHVSKHWQLNVSTHV